MKYFVALFAIVTLLSFRALDNIYSIVVKTIDGSKTELSQFKGKKMLFIVLPLSKQDSAVSINDIVQLQTKYQSSLVVIGIPSEEAGFKIGQEASLKKFYKESGANFIITEGMKVQKGTDQSSLFNWLTSREKNHHFDRDVQGVGTKFFVDERGELYAVFGKQMKLNNPIIDKVIARQRPKNSNILLSQDSSTKRM
ncbi:MAG TPA: hypothetical protein VNS32_04715 [Flavisolibacter sp.]|nr:hypothetical protein [Flavisolibacter sp.]